MQFVPNIPSELPVNSSDNPFLPENESAYSRWRAVKLEKYPRLATDLKVRVADPRRLTAAEFAAIRALCAKANMAIYSSGIGELPEKDIPRKLGAQFGLQRLDANLLADEDAITSLEVVTQKAGRGYIPYTNRRLLWHTDGYYNSPDRQIRAFILHCVRPAAQGGENGLLDPELVYLYLRDIDPAHVRALMAPDAMTIPANTEEGAERPAQSGPVFSVDSGSGRLHMRYTARTRSIEWKDDVATAAAVRALEALLEEGSSCVFRYRLQSGEGLICNNVLHNRTAFEDAVDSGTGRLLYRARYYDRMAGTGLHDGQV